MISINCLVFAFAIILLRWEYLSFVRARARVWRPPLKCIELKYIAIIDYLY